MVNVHYGREGEKGKTTGESNVNPSDPAILRSPSVMALGYSAAAMFLRGAEAARVGAVISIYGCNEFPLDAPSVPHRLALQFDDIDPPDKSDEVAFHRSWVQQKWAAETGRPLRPPTIDDARAIVDFAGRIREVEGIVLCQCGAGMSRSPAAALICLAAWSGAGRERECVAEVMRVRPGATPLIGLVRLGDEVLGLGGRWVSAALEARAGGGAATP